MERLRILVVGACISRLYAAAERGGAEVPWDKGAPHHLLAGWVRERGVSGAGRRAVVVGCGMGRDSEWLAGFGFATVAFDFWAIRLEDFSDSDAHRWRAELHRPATGRRCGGGLNPVRTQPGG